MNVCTTPIVLFGVVISTLFIYIRNIRRYSVSSFKPIVLLTFEFENYFWRDIFLPLEILHHTLVLSFVVCFSFINLQRWNCELWIVRAGRIRRRTWCDCNIKSLNSTFQPISSCKLCWGVVNTIRNCHLKATNHITCLVISIRQCRRSFEFWFNF